MASNLLQQAFDFESKNQFDAAINIYTKALEESPNNKEIFLHIGSCFFAGGEYEKALDFLVMSYMHPEQTAATRKIILQDILAAYYQPNEQEFKDIYEKNTTRLRAYEHNFMQEFLPYEALSYLCIPASDDTFYLFDKNQATFPYCIKNNGNQNFTDLSPQNCYLLVNIFKSEVLERFEKSTNDPSWLNGMKIPVYLIWEDQALLQAYLQINDYQRLIDSARIVFFDSYHNEWAFSKFLSDIQAIFPNKLLGDEQHFAPITQIIQAIDQIRQRNFENQINDIEQWYSSYTREYYRKLFNGSPDKMRILFYTSRFTVVVQYGTRDFMKACQNLGLYCELLIDSSDIHRASNLVLIEKIKEFKPDIIFNIDHLKSEYQNIPGNIMYVTWIQDPLPAFCSKDHVDMFGINDFILSHAPTYTKQLIETGFPGERIVFQTVPVDDTIFHPYQLTAAEIKKYSSDVAICANYSSVYETENSRLIATFSKDVTNEILQQRIAVFFNKIFQHLEELIQKGGMIYNAGQCMKIIDDSLKQLLIDISESVKQEIAERLFLSVSYGLQKKYVALSLIKSGINLKLWGIGWEQIPGASTYVQGWVQHGEELAKVYTGSKIIIGMFSLATTHFRIWEALSCGTLCMVRYLPPEDDLFDIRQFLIEGEHFIFYHNMEDLAEKIQYYLNHEDQRLKIVENAQNYIQRKLTYGVAVKNWLEFTNDYLKKQETDTGVN